MADEQQAWDDVVIKHRGSFLQSWHWGELQRELSVPSWRLSGDEWQALVTTRLMPFGQRWLFVPKGPVLSESSQPASPASQLAALEEFTNEVADLGRRQKAIFIHVDPPAGVELSGQERWHVSDRYVTPQHSIVLDLSKGEDELLAAMHQKTRYNIRLAEKKNVTVRFSKDEKDLEKFFDLSRDVSARGTFHFHPEDYYQAQLKVLGEAGMFEIAVAEHEGDTLAVHLLLSFAGTTTYVHGASASKKRELMAPHLLQWESIKRAQGQGDTQYDFYGVAPENAENHPWSGITRFKEGFGGSRISYPEAVDLVLNRAKYSGYKGAKKTLDILRKFV